MKGLVRYDLTQLTGNSKRSFYLLYFAGLIVVSLAVGGGKIFSYMAVMIGCMMGVSFFSYETWYHWDRYCAALPLSNRQIVVSRYISLLITTGCGVLLGFVIGLLSFAAGRIELSWTQWLASLAQTILVALLYIEIEVPVMYRFGVERGRLVNILLFVVLYSCALALAELSQVPTEFVTIVRIAFGVAWLVILLLFPVSIAVSMRIRAKKEY
ncbi:ABC-2 transporter permease [Butyricicoccus sp.]|uniref:ABC-2 transporter permease n=1 Tax=Butyricicoccus sp. TaxID=2049021 RepID=UPI003D7DAAEF